jgi:fibronectin-binding autotransporter adhesin
MKKKYQAVTIRFTRRFFLPSIMACAVAFALADKSSAADYYFDTNGTTTGSGNAAGAWSATAATWNLTAAGNTTAPVVWADGNNAIFSAGTDGVGANTVTITGTVATPLIKLEEVGVRTLTGGTISIAGGSTFDLSALGVTTGRQPTWASVVSGTGNLILKANGDTSDTGGESTSFFALTGTNTFTGDVTIQSGIVRSNSSLGNAANKVILDGGGLLDPNLNINFARNVEIPAGKTGYYRTYGSVATGQMSGALTGSGTLRHTDGGTLTMSGNGSAFTGTINNARGNMTFTSLGWSGTSYVGQDGATLNVPTAGTTSIKDYAGDRDVNIGAGARLNIVSGNFTASSGAAVNNFWVQGAGKLTSSSGVLTANYPVAYTTATDQAIRVIVEDFDGSTPLKLVKTGIGGIAQFDKANTYTGGTEINGGRITASNTAAFGTGTITVGSGGQAFLNVAGTYPNSIVLNGNGSTETAGTLGALRFNTNTTSGSIQIASAARIAAYGTATGVMNGALTGSSALEINSADASVTGTITINGNAAAFTGATTVTQGRLNLNSSIGGGVSVGTAALAARLDQAAATTITGDVTSSVAAANVLNLAGSVTGNVTSGAGTAAFPGSIGGNLSVNGGTASIGGTIAGTATVADGVTVSAEGTVAGSLTLGTTTGTTLVVDGSNGSAALSSNGLVANGTTTVIATNTPAVAGTPFAVLNYGPGTFTGSTANFQATGAFRSTPVFADTGSAITMSIPNGGSLKWVGADATNPTFWDLNTTTNWDLSGTPEKFLNADLVLFDDTATGTTVALQGSMSPGSIVFNNTTLDFTVNGTGVIAGGTGITKNGEGDLFLGGNNTFAGPVAINQGSVILGNARALGVSSGITIAALAELDFAGQTAATAGNYSFTIAGDGPLGNGVLVNSGVAIASNAGIRNLTLSADSTVGGTNRFDIGLSNGVSGTINGGGFTLSKVGSNLIHLRGPASNITIAVDSGGLIAEDTDAAFGTNPITVNEFATIGSFGTRTIANNLELDNAVITNLGGGTGTWTGTILQTGTSLDVNATSPVVLTNVITSDPAIEFYKLGASSATLTGANATSLDVSRYLVQGGALWASTDGSLGTVPAAVDADYFEVSNGAGIGSADAAGLGTTMTSAVNRGLTINTSGGFNQPAGGVYTFAGDIAESTTGASLLKTGAGETVITGDSSTTGVLTVSGGKLTTSGSAALPTLTNITSTGATAHLNIAGASTVSATGNLSLTAGGVATMADTASLALTTTSGTISNVSIQTGTLNLTGGTLTTTRLVTADAGTTASVINQSGGVLNIVGNNTTNATAASFLLGHWGSGGTSSAYILSGGTINAQATNMSVGWDSTNVTFTQTGGTLNALGINLNNSRANFAALNLTGGRINLGANGMNSQANKQVNAGGVTFGAFGNYTIAKPMALTGTGGATVFDTLDSVDAATARTITLSGIQTGTGGISKVGAGNLVIAGAQLYTGLTSVSGGKIHLNGSLASTVETSATGMLQGGTAGAVGTGTVPNLTMNGGGVNARIGTTGDLINVGTALTVSSASVISAAPSSPLTIGTRYKVIDYTGSIGGLGFAGLSLAPIANPHISATLYDNTVDTSVDVEITAFDALVWKGDVSSAWDLNTTSNWRLSSNAATASPFYEFDVVKFDDTAVTGTVVLTGTIAPSVVEFDNSTLAYDLSGIGISGTAGILKNGTAKVTLTTPNTYSGATTVNAGVLQIGDGTNGSLASTSLVNIAAGAELILHPSVAGSYTNTTTLGGVLRVKGAVNYSFAALDQAGELIVDSSAVISSGATLPNKVTVNSGTLALTGGGFSANRMNGNGVLTVNAPGAVTLTGTHVLGADNGTMTETVVLNGSTLSTVNEQYFRLMTLNGATVTGAGQFRSTNGAIITVGGTAPSTISNSSISFVTSTPQFLVNDATSSSAVDLILSAPLSNGSTGGGFSKTGAGTMSITATHSFDKPIAVTAGRLQFNSDGSLAIGSVVVGLAGTMSGNGSFGGAGASGGTTTVNGRLSPGIGGTETLSTGATTFNAGSTFETTINGTSSSLLAVTGALTLNGSPSLVNLGAVPSVGTKYTIATYTGALTGTFTGVADGATTVISGIPFVVDYNDGGNNVTLTVTVAPYESWASSFGLSAGSALRAADPDGDGISNLMEFYLDGNPTIAGQSILPELDASGANFVFSFTRRDDAAGSVATQMVQYGTTLYSWTDVAIPVAAGVYSVGAATVTVTDGGTTDEVSVSVPKGLETKMFGRLKVESAQ